MSSKIPNGKTISVKVIDLTSIEGCPCRYLHAPPIKGVDVLPPAPSLSFLLEHASGRKLLFDLGVPKDLTKLGPEVNKDLQEIGYNIDVKDDVATFLAKEGVKLDSIEGVIWSHSHWDHKGDMTLFPSSVDLIVGPSSIATFVEGDGNSKLGGITEDDIRGRKVREIEFDTMIGSFEAKDYFGDGSLYVMNSPGHCQGHIMALARTTAETFVLLGGDGAHHCAEYRPSKYLPTPNLSLSREWFKNTNIKRGLDPNGPLYRPLWAYDMEQCLATVEKIQELDGQANILCLIAHDASVRFEGMPFFPETLNDWRKKDLRKHLNWSWVGDVYSVLQRNNAI